MGIFKKTDAEIAAKAGARAAKQALKDAGMSPAQLRARKYLFNDVRIKAKLYGVNMDKTGTISDPNDRRTSGPIIGAAATVDTAQAIGSRVTATRMVTMGVFALAAKKKTGEVFVLIEHPDYAFTAGPISAKDVEGARKWARDFNTVAADAEEFGLPEGTRAAA
ncbi:MAG: hypothetical protein J2P43_01250 [Candidatus Dormibacteraeota bacterium]|nr:hypothetical protein [Candidatus Dormibacteraeota bacterium]